MLQRPGIIPEAIGTISTLAGIYIIWDVWLTPAIKGVLPIGAILIFGGLLLRIEAAIRNVGR
ncbi:hypothetical protein [Actinoplanes sichuanensis]|uniref:Uncharacterized protein n=1 Tax=Actinoplanes sichuanensis TaxID=512349 RepID=A0ABW4AJY5_9ACTN|nr:hypothetical protein [Actinoplanes sichuanensis]